jgi:hypothetical protein
MCYRTDRLRKIDDPVLLRQQIGHWHLCGRQHVVEIGNTR